MPDDPATQSADTSAGSGSATSSTPADTSASGPADTSAGKSAPSPDAADWAALGTELGLTPAQVRAQLARARAAEDKVRTLTTEGQRQQQTVDQQVAAMRAELDQLTADRDNARTEATKDRIAAVAAAKGVPVDLLAGLAGEGKHPTKNELEQLADTLAEFRSRRPERHVSTEDAGAGNGTAVNGAGSGDWLRDAIEKKRQTAQ